MDNTELFDWIRNNQKNKRLNQHQVDAVRTMLTALSVYDVENVISKLNMWEKPSKINNREYNLNYENLKKVYPNINQDVIPIIIRYAPQYEINTKKQMAAFIATCIVESNGFNARRESFAYSAKRLTEVFPKSRIPNLKFAQDLVAQGQVAIANHLYNGRLGNRLGTNDGWDYRGNSWIQITGRSNHYEAQKLTGIPVGDNPKLLENLENACIVTMNWWKLNGLNEKAEKINTYSNGYTLNTLNSAGRETRDYKMNTGARLVRKTVNGGFNGYNEFCGYLELCLKYL